MGLILVACLTGKGRLVLLSNIIALELLCSEHPCLAPKLLRKSESIYLDEQLVISLIQEGLIRKAKTPSSAKSKLWNRSYVRISIFPVIFYNEKRKNISNQCSTYYACFNFWLVRMIVLCQDFPDGWCRAFYFTIRSAAHAY